MSAITRSLVGLLAALLLASCGGGGGSGNNTAFEPAGTRVTVTVASTSTTPNSLVGVTVEARGANGQPLQDGTQVTATVSPPGVGLLSSTSGGNAFDLSDQVTGVLSGGFATFRFHSRSIGTATITASVIDPAGRSISDSKSITVGAGAPNDNRLTIQASTFTIPRKPSNLSFNDSVFFGSPYIAEVTVTQRDLGGSLVSPTASGGTSGQPGCGATSGFGAVVGPGLTPSGIWLPGIGVIAGNIVVCAQAVAPVNSGVSVFYLVADSTTGPVTLTVSSRDPQTNELITAQAQFQIVGGVAQLPGSVVVTSDGSPVYVTGTNAAQSKPLEVQVYDGAGTLVPDPGAGINNVQIEIVGGAQGGERLVGLSASGAPVQGSTIAVQSHNGVANFSYQSGTRQGLVTVRATADRSDNNVGNGIQDGVTSTYGFAVGDGKLFDLRITTPVPNTFVGVDGGDVPGTDGFGNYFIPVGIVATDREGNPVEPGTEIKFGLIDSPKVANSDQFAIAGNDGDPQESGTLFTAPGGHFTTAGGGAGPGDTLVVLGKQSPGNRDLTGARSVATVNSATSLNIASSAPFNPNDDTGQSVNNGPVIPYVIGRATKGNITVSGQTDVFGTATVVMTYPATEIGTQVLVWAQGSGKVVNGVAKLVADTQLIRFQGLGPATLSATPGSIPANTTSDVEVCVLDAGGIGVAEVPITFAFENLVGNGSVNGVATSGTLPQVTGANGCVTASVTTSGVVSQSGSNANANPRVVFRALGQEAEVDIVTQGLLLDAFPNLFFGDGVARIRLRLRDLNGNPVNDALIIVSCEATGKGQLTVNVEPGRTGVDQAIGVCNGVAGQDCDGETWAEIGRQGFECAGSPPTGSCTFSTTTGEPEAVVNFKGEALDAFASPAPPPCQ